MMKMMKMINAAAAGTVFVYCIKFKFCLYFLFECSDYPLISFVFLRYFNLRTLVVWIQHLHSSVVLWKVFQWCQKCCIYLVTMNSEKPFINPVYLYIVHFFESYVFAWNYVVAWKLVAPSACAPSLHVVFFVVFFLPPLKGMGLFMWPESSVLKWKSECGIYNVSLM